MATTVPTKSFSDILPSQVSGPDQLSGLTLRSPFLKIPYAVVFSFAYRPMDDYTAIQTISRVVESNNLTRRLHACCPLIVGLFVLLCLGGLSCKCAQWFPRVNAPFCLRETSTREALYSDNRELS